jgi:hypothetical protein
MYHTKLDEEIIFCVKKKKNILCTISDIQISATVPYTTCFIQHPRAI